MDGWKDGKTNRTDGLDKQIDGQKRRMAMEKDRQPDNEYQDMQTCNTLFIFFVKSSETSQGVYTHKKGDINPSGVFLNIFFVENFEVGYGNLVVGAYV